MMTAKTVGVVLGGLLGVTAAGHAAVITTDSVERFSSQLQNFDNRNAVNIVNDSFDNDDLNNPDAGPGHTSVPFNAMWLTDLANDTDPYIVIDLGSTYSLTSFQVWNYNEADGTNRNRGVQEVEILTSTASSDDADFVSRGTFVFAQAPGVDGYLGETIVFPYTARYVKLDITSNYGGDAYGLSEIQFSQVPEPASLGLLAAGGLMMLNRRRRA